MRGNSHRVGRVVFLAAVGLVSAGAAAACGLTADYSGLQGGTRDAAAGDVGTQPATDGGTGDASGPDSGRDAGGFCASLATPVHFCDDFDEGAAVGAGWSSTDVYQGSSALLDYTYFSPPASFLSSIEQASAPASARLQEDLPLSTPHVHIEFELLLPQANGNFEICTLHQPVADGTTYGLFYKYQSGNLLVFLRTLDEDGGESDFVGQIGPPPTGWLHVEIDCDVSESATIVVKHDGQVVVSASNVNTSTATRASMFVELGYYSDAPATAIAHFDNVIIDWN